MSSFRTSSRASRIFLAVAAFVATLGSYSCGRIRQEDSGELPEHADTNADTSAGATDRDVATGPTGDAGGEANATALDAGRDASVDVPTIDPTLPAPEPACAAGTGTAYLVAENGGFYTFDPSTATTTKVGTLSCPTANPSRTPYTMTVTETDAYVLYNDWSVYRVSLDSLSCTRTPYDGNQVAYPGDVGIATSGGAEESLLVFGTHRDTRDLAVTDDLTTLRLREVGPIMPLPPMGYPVDMKIDGYGRLFASDSQGSLAMIDPASGHVLGFDQTGLRSLSGWALLAFNDGVYFFTGDNGDTFRWNLTTKTAHRLGAAGDKIVGAGSAPCLH